MEQKAKHTPGPWIAEDIYIMAGQKNVTVTVVDISGDQRGDHIVPYNEAHANAHLIAAAPDLLAACKAHQEAVHYQTLCITGQFTDENYAKWDEALDRAHKLRLLALAKAKGE